MTAPSPSTAFSRKVRGSFFKKIGIAAALLVMAPCLAAGLGEAAPPDTGSRLHRVDLEHFTLWSDRELSKTDLYETRRNLQNVRREVGRAFGDFFPKQKFDVVLTRQSVFHSYTGSPSHVSGLFDGTIHLPVKAQGADTRLKAILHHEYTHALLWAAGEGKCPSWMQEGFAVDQEEQIDPRRLTPDPELIVDGRLRWPLDSLDTKLAPNAEDPRSNELAYQAALEVIRFLRSEHRPAELLRWVRQTGKTGSWKAAARDVLRTDAAELERRAAEWVMGRLPKA